MECRRESPRSLCSRVFCGCHSPQIKPQAITRSLTPIPPSHTPTHCCRLCGESQHVPHGPVWGGVSLNLAVTAGPKMYATAWAGTSGIPPGQMTLAVKMADPVPPSLCMHGKAAPTPGTACAIPADNPAKRCLDPEPRTLPDDTHSGLLRHEGVRV